MESDFATASSILYLYIRRKNEHIERCTESRNFKLPPLSLGHKELVFPDVAPEIRSLNRIKEQIFASWKPFIEIRSNYVDLQLKSERILANSEVFLIKRIININNNFNDLDDVWSGKIHAVN